MSQTVCAICGAISPKAAARFCSKCGAKMPAPTAVQPFAPPPLPKRPKVGRTIAITTALLLVLAAAFGAGWKIGHPMGLKHPTGEEILPASGDHTRPSAIPDTREHPTPSEGRDTPGEDEASSSHSDAPTVEDIDIPDEPIDTFREDDETGGDASRRPEGHPHTTDGEEEAPAHRPKQRVLMATSSFPMPGLAAIHKRTLIPVDLDQDLDAEKVKPGDSFTVTAHTEADEGDFGSTTEEDMTAKGLQFEAQVIGVRKAMDGAPAAVFFRMAYLLKPSGNKLLVVPITASLLKPKNAAPSFLDSDDMAHAGQEYGSNLGQMIHGIDGNFNAGAWGWLAGRTMGAIMARQPSYFKGKLKKGTAAFVRIEKNTYY